VEPGRSHETEKSMLTDAPPTTAEHRARLDALIADADLRAVVCSSYQTVSYFGGTHIMTQVSVPDRLEFAIAFAGGDAALLVCDIEASMVRSQSDITDVAEYTEFADVPADALVALLKTRGVTSGRVGYEARRLHADAYLRLTSALPELELVAVDDEVEGLQSVKSSNETEMLKYGAQTTLDAVLATAAEMSTATTELDFAAATFSRMLRGGGQPVFLVFGAGERALQAHAEATDRPFHEGEIWRIDLGARFFDTINSDLARTGVTGEPTTEQEETLRALRATQDAGFAACEPGRPACEVYRVVEAEFERQGLPFRMPHIGHGLGIGLHEFPMLEPKNTTPLEAGMVLNVEPMAVFPDRNECYHTEDLIVVGADESKLLTKPQDSLIRIAG